MPDFPTALQPRFSALCEGLSLDNFAAHCVPIYEQQWVVILKWACDNIGLGPTLGPPADTFKKTGGRTGHSDGRTGNDPCYETMERRFSYYFSRPLLYRLLPVSVLLPSPFVL